MHDPHEPHQGKPRRQRKRATGEPPAPGQWDGFARLIAAMGMAKPETEYRFHAERKWRFDLAWPAHKIALEIEGGVWTRGRHTRPAGFLGDMEKYNEAALAGWCVLRTTTKGVQDGAALRLIERALREAGI